MSVDYPSREEAINVLSKYILGKISNDVFEDLWPEATEDRALSGIEEQTWVLYDDNKENIFKLNKSRFSVKRLFYRELLFLSSDCEYRWPIFSFRRGNLDFFQRLLPGASRKIELQFEEFKKSGEITYWPFLSRKEYLESYTRFHKKVTSRLRAIEKGLSASK